MLNKNDIIELDITGMTHDGSGVGKACDIAVFVPATVIGDKAEVKILKVKKNYCYGKLIKLLRPAECRTEADCDTFLQCGGCTYRHISYDSELEIKLQKVLDTMERIGGIRLPNCTIVGSDKVNGYRNKGQYPVGRDKDGKPCAGFYAVNSHRIVSNIHCRLSPDCFAEALQTVLDFVSDYGISVYDEKSKSGLLRHIYLRYAEMTDELMVCLVINGNSLPCSDKLIQALTEKLPQVKSVALNINRRDTNCILGDKCKVIYGSPYITDVLCGLKFKLSPLSFYQVNRSQAEKLYLNAAEYAAPTGDETLLDLYCGTGTIGLTMADKVKKLIGAEIVQQAVEDARANAKENKIGNAEFICADAFKAAQVLKERDVKPDIVLLDPPRKGCSPELVELIANRFCPDRVVYISCDVATLARDSAIFRENGYTITKATAFDLFPRTPHVETVVLMSKNDSGK